ncbi:MAG: hypothetical protein HYV33_03100 [Candidatus Kerfeldbacteria bacterium]|nr:hypothetical protein [Candidatus Kerfeldbacteria bacterium]
MRPIVERARLHQPEIKQLLQRAETTPAVEHRLFSPEIAAYLMYWKKILNPNSKPYTTIYPGMGPDVATALLTQNTTNFHGLDRHPVLAERLQYYKNRWDDLGVIEKVYCDEPRRSTESIDQWQEEFEADLQYHEENGYYGATRLPVWSLERLLLLELQKLDVTKDSIVINQLAGKTTVSFTWAYPNEASQPRIITFHTADISTLASFQRGLPRADCIMQKAHMDEGIVKRSAILAEARDHLLLPNGRLLITPSSNESSRATQKIDRKHFLDMLRLDFNLVRPPLSLQKLLTDEDGKLRDPYGWYFICAQKRAQL